MSSPPIKIDPRFCKLVEPEKPGTINSQRFDWLLNAIPRQNYRSHRLLLKKDQKKLEISLQGHSDAYCQPREDLPLLSNYQELEMCCWQDGQQVQPSSLTVGVSDIDGRYGDPPAYIPKDRLRYFFGSLLLNGWRLIGTR